MYPILEPESLLGLYERFATATLPLAGDFPERDNDGPSNKVVWEVLEYGRDMAQINTRTGAPQEIAPPIRAIVTATAISMSEKITIPPDVMADLHAPGDRRQKNGQRWVANCVRQLRNRIDKRVALLRCQCIGTAAGALSFTLPGGIAETVDLAYKLSHKSIGDAWGTASTDIIADIETAKEKISQDAGKMATKMIINKSVMAYIRANTKVLSFLDEIAKRDLLLTGRLPRLCELDIEVINDVYVPDSTGTATNYIPDGFCAIMAGDTAERATINCAPVSPHAPDGTKGIFFHSWTEPGIKAQTHIEYEHNVLPIITQPDSLVYDSNVNA
jgi:hypothetical protein